MTANLPFVVCKAEGCVKPRRSKGWCHTHYKQHRRTGLEPKGFIPETTEQRFWLKVAKQDDGCWRWTASTKLGYGTFKVAGRPWLAHRWSYEHFVGPIPDGLQLDHLCKFRGCVNPEHLEPVTSAENNYRSETWAAVNRRKTHCPQGHEYTVENTYLRPRGSRVSRICRTCQRRSCQLFRAKRLIVAAAPRDVPGWRWGDEK